ncbi:hypothetical protein SBRCBS47491_003151 [Sporothrix bragantina]|uniref:Xylanolytic transcriptional activator regulatory domain-containing protein n=1 Tax=Sporothrix bragantina TaxID=671064 RepID=A0ABP0BCR2_9PEZI
MLAEQQPRQQPDNGPLSPAASATAASSTSSAVSVAGTTAVSATTTSNLTSKPAKPKRSSVACRRCRRLRTKCLQAEPGSDRPGRQQNNCNGLPPCLPCREAGPDITKECTYATRGDNADRRFRIKRISYGDVMVPPTAPTSASASVAASRASSVSSSSVMPLPLISTMQMPSQRITAVVPMLQSPVDDDADTLDHDNNDDDNEDDEDRFIRGPLTHSRRQQSSLSHHHHSFHPARAPHGIPPIPASPRRLQVYAASDDIWNLLPPHSELLAGCRVFLATCLQVGFIPKALFLEQMETDPASVNVFLLLSILSISARFTPELCARFRNDGKAAAEFFMDVAHVVTADQMWHTTLENTQAFFLLGMADWGRGARDRSAIHMGIAVRMAGMLRLHREETYRLPTHLEADQVVDAVVDAERARRTFWCIQNHDNLYTQANLPRSFAKPDITTLLPGEETDFAFGRVPAQRAALAGTVPALRDPSLTSLPTQSLFSTLIQAHDLWGIIARSARAGAGTGSEGDSEGGDSGGEGGGSGGGGQGMPTAMPDESESVDDSKPWLPQSRYRHMVSTLQTWEAGIPRAHTWAPWNLRGYKAEHVDMAYLSAVTVTRLNNIVLRRTYLDRIVKAMLHPQGGGNGGGTGEHKRNPSSRDEAPPGFWEQVSYELFSNAWLLYEAVDVWFSSRGVHDGFPAMLAFCTYVCGSLASHLYRWPQLCPRLAPASAATVLNRSIEVLSTFENKWPTASQWSSVLRQVAGQAVYAGVRPVDDVRSQEALLNNSPGGTGTGATNESPAAGSSAANNGNGNGNTTGSNSSTQGYSPQAVRAPRRSVSVSATSAMVPPTLPPPPTAATGLPQTLPPLVDIAANNHLHLLSRAAAYDTAALAVAGVGPGGLPTAPGMATTTNLMPPPPPTTTFDLTDPFADPLDFDFTDIVQGYMHLGWAGWQ